MVTSVPLPSLVTIQAKSPTSRPGAAAGGAVVIVGSPGGVSRCTKATSVGSWPCVSWMPGEVANGERRGVAGSPSGKQPSARGPGGLNTHVLDAASKVGVCCRLSPGPCQRGSGLVSHSTLRSRSMTRTVPSRATA